MPTLVQIDFPATGPWGQEMADAYAGLAADIAGTAGLRWKVWTENAEQQTAGGIYLFDTREAAQAYVHLHTARLEGFGIGSIRALLFDVNEPLSALTRAPLT